MAVQIKIEEFDNSRWVAEISMGGADGKYKAITASDFVGILLAVDAAFREMAPPSAMKALKVRSLWAEP